jgi:pimeloyl-ACP methyl ester carboxylesterase
MTAATPEGPQLAHRYADLGDVRLHYVEAGTGPPVVLLHGFPEFWYSWRYQIPALAAAGFHAVAPDMRGYNWSDKPSSVHSYRVEVLAHDVERLIRACGATRAAVVGHDWGAIVAWWFAMLHPERLTRLAILNVPHPAYTLEPGLMRAAGVPVWRQLLRSWYVFFFQLPGLPEAMLRAGTFAAVRRTLRRDPVRPDAFTDADITRYVEALAQPGALTATVNYYRALLRRNPGAMHARLRRIEAPVLVIWGERDRYLEAGLADPPRRWVPNARVERLPDASHWVQLDRPERVNALLLEFLAPTKPGH